MSPLDFPYLCFMTDQHRCLNRSLEQVSSSSVDAGVGMVQLRKKHLPSGLLDIANRLRALTSGRTLLFINGRFDVALASGVDGVHLSEKSVSVQEARRIAGNKLFIGRSAHNLEGSIVAESEGADFLIAGMFSLQHHIPGGASPGGICWTNSTSM